MTLVVLALQASVFAIVMAFGLRVTPGDLTWGFRHPRALIRVFVAMFVVMPLVAAGLSLAFELRPAVEVALVALAFSPVPPLLPRKEIGAGGEPSRALGLLVAVSVASLVVIPVGVPLVAGWFGLAASVPTGPILRLVALTVLAPLAVGQIVRALAPGAAARLAEPVAKVGSLLLLGAVLAILVRAAPALGALWGEGTVFAMTAFLVAGLVVGHFLAGDRPQDRTVLALSTASRHPGIALVIATLAVPGTEMVGPAVLLYLLLGAGVSAVYLALPGVQLALRRKAGGAAAS